MANLEKRQLRREMTKGLGREEEFWAWANSYFCSPPETATDTVSPLKIGYYNRYIIKENALKDFTATLTAAQAGKYKSGQFKKAVKAYCDYYDFEFNPLSLCGSEQNQKLRRIIKTIDGESTEVLFIATATTPAPGSTDQPTEDLPF